MANTAYAGDINSYRHNQPSTVEEYLEVTCLKSPGINSAIYEYGDVTLKNYLRRLQPNLQNTYQSRKDLISIVYQYTKETLGEALATRTASDLSENPVVLTANHHGIDYFSHSFQGSLLYSLAQSIRSKPLKTVPVFSCANIPLDNATYPQGLLLYQVEAKQLGTMPRKLPVFSNRLRRQLVSSAPSFDEEMVKRARKRLNKLVNDGHISDNIRDTADKVLSEDYNNPLVMEQSTYSNQAVLVNNLIWQRLFQDTNHPSQVVYLELEKIVEKILKLDLQNENSLIWQTMFEASLRNSVLDELDQAPACWDLSQLKKRMQLSKLNASNKKATNGCGTVFFWGINDAGRRVPLHIMPSGDKKAIFVGIDDHNQLWELDYTPEAILTALNDCRLLPSLFTCFLVLSFARGLKCIGSYFQAEYLPNMQKGLVNALRKFPEFDDAATSVQKIDPNFYLSGMLAFMNLIENDMIIPAGPLEIISKGGIKNEDIEKILSLTVRDAHLASLLETLPDFASTLIKSQDWKYQVAKDSLSVLEGKVVIKA